MVKKTLAPEKIKLEVPTYDHLISVDCIVDGALQLVRRRVDDVQPLPDVLAALFTVVLVWPGPTHPGLDVDAGAVFQEKLHRVLVTEKNEHGGFSFAKPITKYLSDKLY